MNDNFCHEVFWFRPHACGDCGVATKEEYVEILEFTHFVEFFSFRKIGENHKEKSLVKKVTVVVALDLGTQCHLVSGRKMPQYLRPHTR